MFKCHCTEDLCSIFHLPWLIYLFHIYSAKRVFCTFTWLFKLNIHIIFSCVTCVRLQNIGTCHGLIQDLKLGRGGGNKIVNVEGIC